MLAILSSPLSAQDQQVAVERETRVNDARSSSSMGVPSASTPSGIGAPSGSSQSTGTSGQGLPNLSNSLPGPGYPSGGSGGSLDRVFINERTSYQNYDTYYRSMQLFNLLMNNYGHQFPRSYFSRYLLNAEPILTPRVAYYALKNSVHAADQLLQASRELDQLRVSYGPAEDSLSAARDPRWTSLMDRIQTLAKQIRQDDSLRLVDVRKSSGKKEIDLARVERLGFAQQAEHLTTLIRRLQSKLDEMWNDTTPAVVSVEHLSQPTFQGLARGIEDLARKLEKPRKS